MKDGTPLPVMVFFHGGGWMTGSGNKFHYGPDRLLDRDVVLVGVNYRLGKFNFEYKFIRFLYINQNIIKVFFTY